MSEASRGQVNTSAAEIYDAFFVPALFQQFAGPVVEAAAIEDGHDVLDVACGTGLAARAALGRTPRVVGVDCNEGMLAVARSRTPEIEWRLGRAEELPFDDACFDRVLCQFGLMFFDDRAGAVAEMRRVLRPGGRLVAAVWTPLETSPGYADMVGLLQRLFGDEVADALRAPFRLGDRAALAELFPDADVRTVAGTARFESIDEWVRMDVKGWTLGDLIDDDQYATLREAARAELGRHVGPDGSVAFDAPARVVVG